MTKARDLMAWTLYSESKRASTLRGLLLVTSFFFTVCLMIEIFWELFGKTPPAENFATFSPLYSVAIFVTTLSLALLLPRGRSLFLGLILGGSLANLVSSLLLSPVSDYFLIFGSEDHYYNLADLGIILGPILYAVFAFRELWILERADRKKLPL